MASEPRDKWDKLDIATKALAGLLLPIIILIVSQRYTTQQKDTDSARLAQQQAADDAQRTADRVTLLLTHLASENARERLLALKFVEYLAQSHQFPEALLPALISVVNDANGEVAHDASHALTQVITLNPNLAKPVEQAAQTNSETRKAVIKAADLNPDLGLVVDVNKIRRAIRE
jgi:hypothetical protein